MFWLPKSFWAACLSWCSFRRAAPRAVGSRSRVGLLARPSSAGVGSGGRRGSYGRVPAAFVWWVPHPPGDPRRPGTPGCGGDGSGDVWLALDRMQKTVLVALASEADFCSELLRRLFDGF